MTCGSQISLPHGRGSACRSGASTYFSLLLVVCLVSCGTGKPSPPLAFPAAAGPWTLTQEKPILAEENPQVLNTLGIVDARAAAYSGPSPVTVRAFRMKSETVAFEALQKWKPEKGIMHFYRGPYFILAETSDKKFVEAFDKAAAWRQGA